MNNLPFKGITIGVKGKREWTTTMNYASCVYFEEDRDKTLNLADNEEYCPLIPESEEHQSAYMSDPSLRVAYIDEVEVREGGKNQKVYYSVFENLDQEIYRIKLAESAKVGENKPEIKNHAIIFNRGEALQTIHMNEDNYLEEAFKMRNLDEEFNEDHGVRPPSILGVREQITGSVSSLAWFMSNQEASSIFSFRDTHLDSGVENGLGSWVPVEIIHILDACVEIPQLGVVRSLNIHVSGAIGSILVSTEDYSKV
ncbi:callose synthase 5-like [Henckelia pumila]|uniref:callose synthase 5-like n=1 Tax=Henckelia pumila TaxID=405737 RepID=UPI003C6E6236